MSKEKSQLIGSTYVNIIKDEEGEIKFAYGYEVDDMEISLNDLAMMCKFLEKIKENADRDWEDRLEKIDKEFEVEIDDNKEFDPKRFINK